MKSARYSAAIFCFIIAAGLTGAALGLTVTARTPSPATGLLVNGRQLHPRGAQVALGNLPTGGAITSDGKFLWTVSAGFGSNDVRIVDTVRHRVCQVLSLPGSSGGIALDSPHRRAYVSGITNSRWQPAKNTMPGAEGNVIFVYGWVSSCGHASLLRVIPVPPPPGAPLVQTFPPIPQRSNEPPGSTNSWPQKLAVSAGGSRLLVPLNLADSAALIDLNNSDRLRYVPMASGAYPFGAAVLPGGRLGLVTNEATGTLSVIDLDNGVDLKNIAVGPPLSHPQGVVVDRTGTRAFVALSASDQVVVVNLRRRNVERTISVGRSVGLGTMPVALALSPRGDRLFVAESGADEISVIRIPGRRSASSSAWKIVGRIPTADEPQAVATAAATAHRSAQLMYVAAKGVGVGPNITGPRPTATNPMDPIFWAFDPTPPTGAIFGKRTGTTYLASMIRGRAGLMSLPSDRQVRQMTHAALRQVHPVNARSAPSGTPLRAGGPIKHVFFVVRENRSYDQILGDVARGNGDPKLTLFGKGITPNMHSLVARFPLLDSVFANSEASIEGHSWTAAASVPDYLDRNWVQQYAGRGRPTDYGVYDVSSPGNGYLFDQAERQHISYFNYGEGFSGGFASNPDRNRSAARLAEQKRVNANSDLGVGITPGGCYPSDMSIGTTLDQKSEVFDSSLPAGAPAGSYSHIDCFKQRFAGQLAAGKIPAMNYLAMTSDHTRGTQPGFPIPNAMVADSDQAIGQLVDLISHSKVWRSSAIFVVEDDSQDGADHVDAHRIPALVVSPYARRGVVLHNRYDLLSVTRSMELILGMKPLSLNDALATPMYDAFSSTAANAAPVNAIPAKINLLTYNQPSAPWAALSRSLPLGRPDQVPQALLDAILWKSAHGERSTPPPPGPNANPGQ